MPDLASLVSQIQQKHQQYGDPISSQDQFALDYWNKIQKYKDTSYYQQLLNNPYIGQEYSGSTVGNLLQSDLLYLLSFGLSDQIGQSINDTGRAQFYQQQNQAANEEFDRILGLIQQNQYNSEPTQAGRLAAAGINPRISGVNSQAAATNGGPDETASPDSAARISEAQNAQVSQIGGMMQSFVSGIMNLYSFFQDAEGKSIGNAAGDITLADSVYNYAVKAAAGMSSLPSSREEYDALSEEEKMSADTTVYETLKAATKTGELGSMQLNRRARGMLKKMTGRVMYDKEGKPTLAFQQQRAAMLKSFYGDTLEAGKAAGHPIMSTPEDFATVMEKAVTFFGDFEQKARDTMFKLQDINLRTASAEARSAETSANYVETTMDQESADSEKAALQAERAQRKLLAELDSYLDSQLDTLLGELDNYGIGGKIGKIAIIGLRSALKNFAASLAPTKVGKGIKMMPTFGIQ